MHGFVRNLITEWRRLDLPFSGATVLIGVSGGADSVSLLLGMHELVSSAKLDLRIVAAHFNHRLRDGQSDADEQFVRELTTGRSIEFAVGHAGPLGEGNLEQNARNARYAFLTGTAEKVNGFAVLTGHTVNDQAETFLMNLIRGSGPTGLCGMKSVRPINDEPPKPADGCEPGADETPEPFLFPTSRLLVRPLLTWAKRRDTEGFCVDSGVEYRYDTMNEDTAFKRVRIRKVLLPLLEDMNPNIIETLANTAGLMQDIPEMSRNGNRSDEPDELILRELRALSEGELRDRLRSWLGHHRGTMRQLQLKHIQAVERLLSSTKSGRSAEVPGGAVIKTGGRLTYKENKVEN